MPYLAVPISEVAGTTGTNWLATPVLRETGGLQKDTSTW